MVNPPEWITTVTSPVFPKWELVRVEYAPVNDPCNNGSVNVYCVAYNKQGEYQQGVKLWQDWKDDKASDVTKRKGEVEYCGEDYGLTFYMSGDSSFDPSKGQRGPYSCYVDGNSDRVNGLGLPLKRHVQYTIAWRWSEQPITPPIPPPLEKKWVITYQDVNKIVMELK